MKEALTISWPGAARSGLKLRSSAGPEELNPVGWPAASLFGTFTCAQQNRTVCQPVDSHVACVLTSLHGCPHG